MLICPAASVSPFPHEQLFVEEINGEKMPTYMRWLAITYAPTMALACAAVLPCGVDRHGLPFGIQVIGRNGADAFVLEVAHALEAGVGGGQGDGTARAGSGQVISVTGETHLRHGPPRGASFRPRPIRPTGRTRRRG